MKQFRMSEWMLVTVLLLTAVGVTAPDQFSVVVFKTCLVALCGWMGYWFDRGVAPTCRPNNPDLTTTERAAASLRRAIIIGAAMIAGSLGA